MNNLNLSRILAGRPRVANSVWLPSLMVGCALAWPRRIRQEQNLIPGMMKQTRVFTKNKIHSLFISLALLASVPAAEAQPTLGIAPTNNQVILYWPSSTHGTNGVLQSATSLVSPNWLSATDAFPVNYDSQIAVSVSNVPSARFFRLSLVPPTADGMAFIPAGSFTIGDTTIGPTPTNVYVSSFYMDTNLVSLSQWQGVYSYATSHGYSFADAGSGKALNHPVQTVDWYDCVKWCNARSQQADLTPVYYTDAGLTQVFTNGENVTTVYANWSANGYRLPTEAEWEKAARGGLTGQRFPWGETIDWSHANYKADPASLDPVNGYSYDLATATGYDPAFMNGVMPYTSPGGYFAANGYGLNDMAGNVYEWCWDWYDLRYATGSPYWGGTDPRGPASSSYGGRVVRGGAWNSVAYDALCADRNYSYESQFYGAINYCGFRCVRGF